MPAAAPASSRGFRPDVEGLRGVAVLAVVLYHAGVGVMGGGYVGVDVFFVISGFLITGLLLRELNESRRVSFAGFYARRVRRLLPASVLVLAVTVVASSFVIAPLEMRAVTKDAASAALYFINYRLASISTNYLAARGAPSPMQQYWTLAVEEQFYLVWPALLLATSLVWRPSRRFSRRSVIVAMAAVITASFVLCVNLTNKSQPWAFFSLPTRLWELALGGAVALALPSLRRVPKLTAALCGWIGFALIVYAVVHYNGQTLFPGTAALVPVGGAALLIAAGAVAPRRGASMVLAWRPLQAAGRISYSWYLWHWPVLVLVPLAVGHALSLPENLLLVVASGALAALTVKLVEDPVRYSPRLTRRVCRSLVIGAGLTAFALACTFLVSASLPSLTGNRPAQALALQPTTPSAQAAASTAPTTTSPASRLAVLQASVEQAVSSSVGTQEIPSNLSPSLVDAHGDKAEPFVDGCNETYTVSTVSPCVYGDPQGSPTIVLFGDSHATQWFPALDAIAQFRHWRLVVLAKTTCPPNVISIFSPVLNRPYTECDQFREAAFARIAQEKPAMVVVGVARHYDDSYHFQVFGQPWLDGLTQTVRRIRATGAAVMVMSPTPKSDLTDVPDCLSAHLTDVQSCTTTTATSVNAGGFAAEQAAVRAAGGAYIDVTPWVCTTATCAVVVGNLLVYRDDNHLTTKFVSWLTPIIAAELDVNMDHG
jgi:peptidoglycan/LPS O-acetylase OafA/YrhL